MNRINERSFIALSVMTDTFPLLCMTGSISLMTAAGFIIGTLMQAVLALPLAAVYRSGGSFSSAGRAVRLLYLIITVSWGASLFDMLWRTSGTVYIPGEGSGIAGKLMVAGCIAAVCLYIAVSGLSTLSRSGAVTALTAALLLIVFAVSSLSHADLKSLSFTHGAGSLFTETIRGIALSGGTGSFAVLLGYAKGDPVRTALRCFLTKAAAAGILLAAVLFITAPVMDIVRFPAVMAAQLSQPFPSQRIDSLFMIVFACLAVYSIAVQTVSASMAAVSLFPAAERYAPAAVLLLMTAGALMSGAQTELSPLRAAVNTAALLILPAAQYAGKKMRIENA